MVAARSHPGPGTLLAALVGLAGIAGACAEPPEPLVAYDGLKIVAPSGERLLEVAGEGPEVARGFEFDDPDEPGWRVPAAGVALSDGGALSFEGKDRSRVAVARDLELPCVDADELALRVRGDGLLFVRWRAEDGGDPVSGRAAFPLAPPDGRADAWSVSTADLGGNPAWRGTVRVLRIEMVQRATDVAVDWLRFRRTPRAARLARLDSPHGTLVAIDTERRRSRPLTADAPRRFDLDGAAAGDRLRFAVGVPREVAARSGALSVRVRGGGLDEVVGVGRDAGWRDVELVLPRPGAAVEVSLVGGAADGGAADHVLLTVARVAGGTRSTRPNVLLVTIDTLRRDVLGCYGDPVTRTPTLDALARAGVLFERVTSAANVTAPSHASILSSMFLKDHGLYTNTSRLAERPLLLAEHLSAAGYATAAAIGSVVLTPGVSNLGQGFETFFDTHEGKRRGAEVNEDVAGWLERRAGEPWFAWVHYYEPHRPYHADAVSAGDYYEGDPTDPAHGGLPFEPRAPLVEGESGIEDVDYLVALYRAEVTAADEALGELLEVIDDLGQTDDTLVVVTADHGESLTEHGVFFDHGGLFPETVQVPWIVRGPGVAAGVRVPGTAQTVDVAPTILAALGREVPPGMRGVARPLGGDAGAADDPVDPDGRQYFEHSAGLAVGVRSSRHHAVLNLRRHRRGDGPDRHVHPGLELFDHVADPTLTRDLAAEDVSLARRLTRHLERWREDRIGLEGIEVELSDAQRAALEQLGYLGEDD